MWTRLFRKREREKETNTEQKSLKNIKVQKDESGDVIIQPPLSLSPVSVGSKSTLPKEEDRMESKKSLFATNTFTKSADNCYER